mmetsp:Transcript_77222/g.136272  ORF Transcript_77222/g.136272 Transcript_77222/m.136272 type:complete len:151 (+) Transcript_77222:39-491(+)
MSEITEEQLAKFQQVFEEYEEDFGGVVKRKQIGRILRACGGNPSKALIAELVGTGLPDDKLKFSDFVDIAGIELANISLDGIDEDKLREMFDVLDREEVGILNLKELKSLLTSVGDEKLTGEEVDHVLKRIDKDGDQKMNFKEFVRLMSM